MDHRVVSASVRIAALFLASALTACGAPSSTGASCARVLYWHDELYFGAGPNHYPRAGAPEGTGAMPLECMGRKRVRVEVHRVGVVNTKAQALSSSEGSSL